MKNFKLKIFVFSILLALPYSSFAQKQLVKTVYKGAKGLFKTEAKVLIKEGIEATNKSILKDAFKSGAEEIGKECSMICSILNSTTTLVSLTSEMMSLLLVETELSLSILE